MKNHIKITLGLLFGLFISMTSCELADLQSEGDIQGQEENSVVFPEGLPATETEFAALFHGGTQNAWSTLAFTISGIDGLQDCRLDDKITINADGTYEYDGGLKLCGAEDDQRIKSGTWMVNADLDQLVFDKGTANEYWANLDALVQDTLAVSGSYLGLEIKGMYVVK